MPGKQDKKRTVLVLDYDGTLHDSSIVYEPAFRSVMKEIASLGWIPYEEYSREEIRRWIGFSAAEMWLCFHPELSDAQRNYAGKRIGEHMLSDIAAGRGRLYPGAQEALAELKEDYELIFLSNCLSSYADAHRKAFGLDRWISGYYCTGDYGFSQKEEVFAGHIYEPGRRYIVAGDRIKDMNLASACGLKSIGCLYGFGSAKELENADALISDISGLKAAADSLNF